MPYRKDTLPAEVDRSILVVAHQGRVQGVDRATGETRWENSLSLSYGQGAYSEVFIAMRYNLLLVSGLMPYVYRLDYLSGETLWRKSVGAKGPATMLIEHDSIVVAKHGFLACLDYDGTILWKNSEIKGAGVGATSLGYPGNVAQGQ